MISIYAMLKSHMFIRAGEALTLLPAQMPPIAGRTSHMGGCRGGAGGGVTDIYTSVGKIGILVCKQSFRGTKLVNSFEKCEHLEKLKLFFKVLLYMNLRASVILAT